MAFTDSETAAIREIFFASSSRQNFASPEERDKFFDTWTGYYFANEPEWILLDRDGGGGVRGYLMGCVDSARAEDYYRERLKSYALFRDLFARFPAHLHINVSPNARSQGVGARLIEKFASELRGRGVKGVHIVTSPESKNREFYRRNGFSFEEIRPWQTHALLFMGREL